MTDAAVSIAILAGGRSSRMGRDKSFVLLDGRPLIEHVLVRLKPLGLPIFIVTNTPEAYAAYQVPTFPDVLPDQGALGGLYTALQASTTEYTLCVACDMPFLNTELLTYLIKLREASEADVITPRLHGYAETLHTVYRQTCLAPIREQLEQGNLRISAFYDRMRVRYLEENEMRRFDPDLRSCVNLNTPEDLAAAQPPRQAE
jgi:molybdopterin-guanine dinucleotide biosynthesis protein A